MSDGASPGSSSISAEGLAGLESSTKGYKKIQLEKSAIEGQASLTCGGHAPTSSASGQETPPILAMPEHGVLSSLHSQAESIVRQGTPSAFDGQGS